MGRGFTLLEVAIVLTILAVVTPAIFLPLRSIADDHARAVARLEDVDGAGPCFPIDYRVDGSVLYREAPAACGGTQALARHVRGITSEDGVVTLVLGVEGEAPLPIALAPGGAR